MRVEIFSDTICPWCYIGKRRLERALAMRPDLELTVTWRAFQLNPEMPAEGMDRRAYLEAKFGGPEGARSVYARVEAAGLEEAIPFDFGAIPRTPNTIDSHRVIHYATGEAAGQDPVVEALFRAYFIEGRDIGDSETLADVAGEAGLDRQAVLDHLASDAGRHEVHNEDFMARSGGIGGVPMFIFDRRYAVSGAQSPEYLVQVLDAAAAEHAV